MSVNIPEQKKKEGSLDTLSSITSIAANAYSIYDKAGEKKPDESTAQTRRMDKLKTQATV